MSGELGREVGRRLRQQHRGQKCSRITSSLSLSGSLVFTCSLLFVVQMWDGDGEKCVCGISEGERQSIHTSRQTFSRKNPALPFLVAVKAR